MNFPQYCTAFKYDHDFLVDVLGKVSLRFKHLATDFSLWKGNVHVGIPVLERGRKDEFVVRECINSGTRVFIMWGDAERLADPTTRFPKLKRQVESGHWQMVYRRNDEDSDDEKEA